jgi:hypothetical protein
MRANLTVSSGAIVTDPVASDDVQGGLAEQEKRDNVIELAFGGRCELFEAFCRTLEAAVPPGTTAILRGSAVTRRRWKDNAPFDADGPGSSDLDVTLIGAGAVGLFKPTGFFVPAIHSRPLSDKDPDIAPDLVPLRRRLVEMVRRPVTIQASRDLVIQLRGDLLGQPYLTLFERPEEPLAGKDSTRD